LELQRASTKIGLVYGSPETTPGGNALKFYASVRLDIRKTGTIKNGERIAQGRDKACQHLGEHPALVDELREKLGALRNAKNARLGAPIQVVGAESEAA
jgi:RecA/RadA recombinase